MARQKMALQYQTGGMTALEHSLSHQFESYFPLVYCINLASRPLRYAQVKQQFYRQQIYHVKRLAAIDGQQVKPIAGWQGSAGAYGCLQSHLQAVKAAKQADSPNILIFEDDVELCENFCAQILKAVAQLPEDWDMLFLGAIHQQDPEPVSSGIKRLKQAYTTLGYAIRNTIYDDFIALNQEAVQPVDVNQSVLFERFNCYCTMPHLAWVSSSYSDTDHRQVDHWYIRDSLVIFGKKMNQRLAQSCVILVVDDNTCGDDLDFSLRYYREYFQGLLNVCVIDLSVQGRSVDCHHYYYLGPCEAFAGCQQQKFAYQQAVTKLAQDANYHYMVFASVNVYIEAMDFRANLLICDNYDVCVGFAKKLLLKDKQSKLLRHKLHAKGLDVSSAECFERQSNGDYHYFVTTNKTSRLLQWLATQPSDHNNLNMFYSPNHALQLITDRSEDYGSEISLDVT